MSQLPNKGLENLVNANVIFIGSEDKNLPENIKITKLTDRDYIIGPCGKDNHLGVEVCRNPYMENTVDAFLTSPGGIVTLHLSDDSIYEIHQTESTLPKDRKYENFSVQDYLNRYKAVRENT